MSLKEDYDLVKIYDLLGKLGASANYRGFFFTAYAIALSIEQPQRLLMVTKNLYPDVAQHYETSWKIVERNIRTLIAVIWRENPQFLCEIAGYPLVDKPRPARFLSMMVTYCSQHLDI